MPRRTVFGATALVAAAAFVAIASPAFAFPSYLLTTNNPSTANSTAGTVSYSATQSSTLVMSDATAPTTNWTCTAGVGTSLTGAVTRGSQASPQYGSVPLVRLGSATYSGWSHSGGTITPGTNPCLGFGGSVPIAVRNIAGSTWKLSVAGPSNGSAHPPTLPAANQVTPVVLSDIKAEVAIGKSNSCYFQLGGIDTRSPATYKTTTGSPTFGGSVNGSYANSTGRGTLNLTSAGSLRVWNVDNPGNPGTGCIAGAINNGDVWTLSGSLAVAAVSPATDAIWLNS